MNDHDERRRRPSKQAPGDQDKDTGGGSKTAAPGTDERADARQVERPTEAELYEGFMG